MTAGDYMKINKVANMMLRLVFNIIIVSYVEEYTMYNSMVIEL